MRQYGLLNRAFAAAADLYSMSMLLYELFVGPPFAGIPTDLKQRLPFQVAQEGLRPTVCSIYFCGHRFSHVFTASSGPACSAGHSNPGLLGI